MGRARSPLPKPVDSVLIERRGASSFKIGVAGMNGWRPSMEDSHVIHVDDNSGFFGVFDGHGGSDCAEFLARRLHEELESRGVPEDDMAVKDLMLSLDKEFLDTSKPSGSTGTFAIIEKPEASQGPCILRIGNTGDSRVLLGHANGDIFQGPGTDLGLTTDHSPDLPSERKRIERRGYKVKTLDGVARIDGDLSVSRAFGDFRYKQSPDVPLQDQAVSADPDLATFCCKASDFVMLMCDGICEGQFSNTAAVSLAASQLQEHGDPGRAAAAVCQKALAENSRDNLTCMIVLLCGGELGPEIEFLPGSFKAPDHAGFKQAYEEAAQAANLSLGQAIERRYDMLKQEVFCGMVGERKEDLKRELDTFHGGPLPSLSMRERVQWFEDWISKRQNGSEMWSSIIMMSQQVRPREKPGSLRSVMVPSEDVLRSAFGKHSALKWEARVAQACNAEAQVVEDDASDGTSMVQYGPGFLTKAWLPTAVLIEV